MRLNVRHVIPDGHMFVCLLFRCFEANVEEETLHESQLLSSLPQPLHPDEQQEQHQRLQAERCGCLLEQTVIQFNREILQRQR